MKLSLKSTLYQAIIEDKWIDISYVNREKKNTEYYIGIIDIDIQKERIACDIFNPYKDNACLEDKSKRTIYINIDGICRAKVLEQSYYPVPEELKKKIKEKLEELSPQLISGQILYEQIKKGEIKSIHFWDGAYFIQTTLNNRMTLYAFGEIIQKLFEVSDDFSYEFSPNGLLLKDRDNWVINLFKKENNVFICI